MQKSQFFKSLHKILPKMPKRVVHQRVLPALSLELRNHPMIPFILPNVLLIAEDSTVDEYARIILPVLIPVFRVQEPIQVLLIFLQKMDLLLTRTPPDAVRTEVLPMIFRALDSQAPQIQELCVSILPSFANMIDYTSMKHAIVPKLTNLCLNTTSLKVRINVLVCIGKMLDVLDKWLIQDHVLPLLEALPSREPGVLMATLGILKEVLNKKKLGFDKEILSRRVLPFVLPLSIEPGLNENQFRTFMAVIRDMLKKVEDDHATYLQQLGQMQQETRSSVKFAQEVSETKAMDDMLDKMEKLMGKDEKSAGESPSVLRPSPAVSASSVPAPLDSTRAEEMDRLFAGLDAFGSTLSSAGTSQQNTIPVLSKPPDSPSPSPSPVVSSKQNTSTGWSITPTTTSNVTSTGWSIMTPTTTSSVATTNIASTGWSMTSSTTSTVGMTSQPLLTGGSVFSDQSVLQSSSMVTRPLQPTTMSAAPMNNPAPGIPPMLPQTAVTVSKTLPISNNIKPMQPEASTAVNSSGMESLFSGMQPLKPQSPSVSTVPATTSLLSSMSGGGGDGLLPATSSMSTRSQQGMSSQLGGFGQGLSGGGLLEPMKPQPNSYSSASLTSSLNHPSPGVTHRQSPDSFGQFEEAKPGPLVSPSQGQTTPLEPMKTHTTIPSVAAQSLMGRRAPLQPASSTPMQIGSHPSSLTMTHKVQSSSPTYPVSSTTQGQSASMSWSQHQNVKTQSSPQMPNFASSGGKPTSMGQSQQLIAARPQSSQLSTRDQNVSGLAGIHPQSMQNFQQDFSSSTVGFGQPVSGFLQPTQPGQSWNQWSGTSSVSQDMGTINWNQPQTNQMSGVNPMGTNQGQTLVPQSRPQTNPMIGINPMGTNQGQSMVPQSRLQTNQMVGINSMGTNQGQTMVPQSRSQTNQMVGINPMGTNQGQFTQPNTQSFGFQPQGMLQPTQSMLNPGTMPLQPASGPNPFASVENLY
jgi:hypothetical protein